MFFIDSHCHIDQLNYNTLHKNIEDLLKKSYKYHVKKFLNVSTSIDNFYQIKKVLKQYDSIYHSCGIHPLNCTKELKKFITEEKLFNKIETLSDVNRVIALGETGLDYHYSSDTKKIQKKFFREQIRIAKKLKKPIIIHSRHSINDVIKILKEENSKGCTGVIHSFTEDYNSALKLLELGFYISFSGIITFKNSIELCNTLKKIPLERLLIETDSPYLSPVPYRGKENQPAYLLEIAKKVSILKKTNLENLSLIIQKNFYTLFNIK